MRREPVRSHVFQIGVVADIRKAFLQIGIHPEDRDFLRFLWWEDVETHKLKVYQHNRVVLGASCSPFLLERTPEPFKDTAQRLRNSFYVDNCLSSFDTAVEVQRFITEAQQINVGRWIRASWMVIQRE
uniref:Reverse transcriptase domain-containing protein n=1 Tax=Trichuris muris TaxID=70415 RepID=A0A5S6PZY4_TRIMR